MAILLVAAGASVACTDARGWTPQHHAGLDNHTWVATLLIAAGASASSTYKNGLTPRMIEPMYHGIPCASLVALLEAAEKRETARDRDGPAHP
jgi:ankyrin repeat protein